VRDVRFVVFTVMKIQVMVFLVLRNSWMKYDFSCEFMCFDFSRKGFIE